MQVNLFTSSFKKYIKRIVAILLLIMAIGYVCASYMQITRERRSDYLYDFYNNVEENTIDVLCIGSSHIGMGLNPIQMWDDYGIAAYSIWGGSQAIWFSYYYLEEALKTQTPKIVIMDVYGVHQLDDYYLAKISMNLMTMKAGRTKYEALKTAGTDDMVGDFLVFPVTHTKYKDINISSYETSDTCTLGYTYSTVIETYEDVEDVSGVTGVAPISSKAEEYIRKSIELCQEKGIEIILTNTPWPCITSESQMRYNYVDKIAQEYGVPFINGCLYTEEIGLNYMTDSSGDYGHLNHSGVTKYTTWMEGYLKERYALEDHRGDTDYEHWMEASVRFQETLELDRIRQLEDATEYLDALLSNENYYTVIMYNGNVNELPMDVKSLLIGYGIYMQEPSVCIVEDGEIVYEATVREAYDYIEYRDKRVFHISSDGMAQTVMIEDSKLCTLDDSEEARIMIYSYNKLLGYGSWNLKEFTFN